MATVPPRLAMSKLQGRQIMKLDPVAPTPQVRLHLPAPRRDVEPGVVTDHMDHPIAPQPATQVVQVPHQQRGVALAPFGQHQRSRSPVHRAGQVALRIGPRRLHPRLLSLAHPPAADRRVGVAVHLVLEDRRFVRGQVGQQAAQGLQLGRPPRVLGAPCRAGAPPDQLRRPQPAADRLAAHRHRKDLQQHAGDDRTRPAAAQPAEGAGRLFGDPADHHGDPEAGPAGTAAGPVKVPNCKAVQLCGQVTQVLVDALACSADDVLRDLLVEAVVPAPSSARLLVTVRKPPEVAAATVLARLEGARGWLRGEVAGAVHRRKTPDPTSGVVE
jgi:ribosome-binding factor A